MNLTEEIIRENLRPRRSGPSFFKTIVVLLLLGGITGLIAAYFLFFDSRNQKAYTEQFNLQIQTYSVNGEITAIKDGELTLKAGIVRGDKNDNKFVFEDKTVLITDSVDIVKIIITNGLISRETGSIDDLKTGKNITVYTTTDPAKSDKLTITKIEIIQ